MNRFPNFCCNEFKRVYSVICSDFWSDKIKFCSISGIGNSVKNDGISDLPLIILQLNSVILNLKISNFNISKLLKYGTALSLLYVKNTVILFGTNVC